MSGVPALGTDKNAWRNSITIPEGLSGNFYVRAVGTQMLRRAFVMSGVPALGTDKNAWRNSITIPVGLSGNLYVRAVGTRMRLSCTVLMGRTNRRESDLC